MRDSLRRLKKMLRLPSLCVLCNQYYPDMLAVCPECIALFKLLGPSCKHCATPLLDSTFLICGYCLKKKSFVDNAFVPYVYEEPLRSLLHEYKYKEGLYLTQFFADLIAKAVPKEAMNTECLIPVPIHSRRLAERGFNQAALLAKQLAKRFKLKCEVSYCKKIHNTPSQAGLNAKMRQSNLKNVFRVTQNRYKYVTLIDDLMTTANTVSELAKTLKQSGVLRVDVWAFAKAPSSPDLWSKKDQ